MADLIEDQLAEAGRLLRDWRDEQLELGDSVVRLEPTPLATLPQTGERSWARVGAAAAAVVLLAGALAAVAWNRRDDGMPVASGSSTVALVPPSLDGWDEVTVHGPEDAEPVELEETVVVLARTGTEPIDGEFVRLMTLRVEGAWNEPDGAEPVDVGGREGWLAEDSFGQRTLQVGPTAGPGTLLVALAGHQVPASDLIELASAFDAEEPLDGQAIPDGWTFEVGGSELTASVARSLGLTRGLGDPSSTTEWENLSISSVTNISPRAAQWLLVTPNTEPMNVRGQDGWLSYRSEAMAFGSLTWVEHSGLLIVINYGSGDPSRDLVQAMRDVAESLVPVDAAGWDEIARQATGQTGSSAGTGSVGTEHDWTDMIETTIGDRTVQVYSLASTGQLCWRLLGEEIPKCDPGGSLGIDGEQATQPRLASDADGTSLFLYGFMPPGANSVRVTAISQAGSDTTTIVVNGRIWVFPLAPDYDAADVEYLDDSGNVIAGGSLG